VLSAILTDVQGTYEFMAYEVSAMGYFWYSATGSTEDEPIGGDYSALLPSQDGVQYEFRFNPIHDFESLWWMYTWFLTRNSPAGLPRNEGQESWHHVLFVLQRSRWDILSADQEFSRLMATLPDEFHVAKNGFSTFRRYLSKAYKLAESSSQSFDSSPFGDSQLPFSVVKMLKDVSEQSPELPFQRSSQKRKKAANLEPSPVSKRTRNPSSRIQDLAAKKEAEAQDSSGHESFRSGRQTPGDTKGKGRSRG
jgi:hypothetical protein